MGNKVVGFLCAAGGKSSYMSVMRLANSLMLDFRCLIIPHFD
jgi:FMN reductase